VNAKKCPRCGHPMMYLGDTRGIWEDGHDVKLEFWCANCHHRIYPRSKDARATQR